MTPAAIRDLRKNTLKLSQVELAQLLGLNAMTVMRWEKGRSEPSPWHRGLMYALERSTARDLSNLMADWGPVQALITALKEIPP